MLTEAKNLGVEVVCGGLKGPPDSITTRLPLATIQAFVIHVLRNTFRFDGRPSGR